jgi:outer membrane protein insertion porin family
LSFPVSENGRLAVFYALEYTDLTNVNLQASEIIKDEAEIGVVTTNAFGYNYSFDTRRTGLNPSAGVLLRFGQEFGFGDARFIKTTASATAETKVLNEDLTLRVTVEGGHLGYQDGSSRVTDRFSLNSRSIRGFEPGGVGPRDADTDDALGGNTFAVVRFEAEFPLGLPSEYGITGGVFFDYGSVWDVGETGTSNVLYDDAIPRSVIGASIFWTTPVGPLRFNFTEALDVQEFDNPKFFDLTISTNF